MRTIAKDKSRDSSSIMNYVTLHRLSDSSVGLSESIRFAKVNGGRSIQLIGG